MVSANVLAPQALQSAPEAVAIRPSVRLPAWLEVAKPRLIPLLLATTLAGMAVTPEWPPSPLRITCTRGSRNFRR